VPPDEGNQPHAYLEATPERAEFLLDLVRRQVSPKDPVIEIGCNVGRNLEHLRAAGFSNLTGIEINSEAIDLIAEVYPDLHASATLINAPIESAIGEMADDSFELVYSMAVLEHIHPDSEWVFAELVRIARRFVITIEDEASVSERHFPRNYREVFEPLGLVEIESVEDLSTVDGLDSSFRARVFRKPE
jgi:SAM-dependent methyltransferase